MNSDKIKEIQAWLKKWDADVNNVEKNDLELLCDFAAQFQAKQKQSAVWCFSKSELEDLLSKTWDASQNKINEQIFGYYKNKSEYIQSVTKAAQTPPHENL